MKKPGSLNVRKEDSIKFLGIFNKLKDKNDEFKAMLLTSPLGTGKTFFIENELIPSLTNDKNNYVFYFNAWASDYMDDPLEGFLGELTENLISKLKPDKIDNSDIKQKIVNLLNILSIGSKKSAPIIGLADPASGVIAKGVGDLTGMCADAISVKKIGTDIENILCTVDKTKQAFKELIYALKTQSVSLILLIDEVERCKPDHALRFLECIKHVMCLGEIQYIISADIDYLKNAVMHFYGDKIVPEDYLRKFFLVGYKLTRIKKDDFLYFINEFNSNSELNNIIAFVAEETNSDLRIIERFLYILEASCKEREKDIFDIVSWIASGINGDLRRLLAYFYIWLFFMSYKDRKFIDYVKLAGQKKSSEVNENQKKYISLRIKSFLDHIETTSINASFRVFLTKNKSFFAEPDLSPYLQANQADQNDFCHINEEFIYLINGTRIVKKYSEAYFFEFYFPYVYALVDSLENCNFLI